MRKYFERLERNRYLPSSLTGHGYDGWLTTSLTQLTLVLEDQKLLSLVIAAATAAGKALLGKIINTVSGLGEVLTRRLAVRTLGHIKFLLLSMSRNTSVLVLESSFWTQQTLSTRMALAITILMFSSKPWSPMFVSTTPVTSPGQPALTSRRERVCTGQTHDPEMQLQSPLEAPMLPVKLFLLLVPSILPSC